MKAIILLLLLMNSNLVFAADVVDEIFEISGIQAEFEAQYAPLAASIFRDSGNANSDNAKIQKLRKQVIEKQETLFGEYFSWESAKSDLKALYYEVYSQEELQAYSRFIQTEAGKSFMDKSEQIIVQYRMLIEQRAATFVEKKETIIDEYQKEVRQYEGGQ